MSDPTPPGAQPREDLNDPERPQDPGAPGASAPGDGATRPGDADGADDRTERLMPDGTVGSARPSAPRVVARPGAPAGSSGAKPPAPATPSGPPPRRRSRDEDSPPPLPVEQLPTSELAASRPVAEGAHAPEDTHVPEDTQPPVGSRSPEDTEDTVTRSDDPSDLETTLVVPAAVVPRDLFDDVPGGPAAAQEGGTAGSIDDDSSAAAHVEPPDGPHDGAHDGGHDEAHDEAHDDAATRGDRRARAGWRRPALLAPLGVLLALGVTYAVDLVAAGSDVPRHTVVAGVDIGGLSPAAAGAVLTEQLAPRVVTDHVIVADGVQGTLSPATAGITLDVDGTVQAASGQPLNPWTRLVSLVTDRTVDPVITGDETALDAQLEQFAGTVDRAPSDATIALDGTAAAAVPAVTGRTLDRAGSADAVTAALASGGDPSTPIELPVDTTDVLVHEDAAQRALEETVTPALSAPIGVVSDDGTTSAELSPEGIAAALTFTGEPDGSLAVGLDPAGLQAALGDQLGEFGVPAKDATFQISGDSIAVVPSVDGTGIDPAALADQLRPALTQPAPRQVTASLGPVPADFTTEEANALGVVEKVSSFTTTFTSQASGTNIRVVAAEVDGALVLPGETFSLNGYTGPRGEAQGYVPAGVINNGEFTQAVGGGISQFATTMFNAMFFAGLEDVFHKPHSYYISRYPAGREATVYYDSIDLKWRNDSPTGIYVQAVWTPNSITVTFWGTQRYDISSVSSDRYNVRTPVVQEKPDDGSCSPQAGANGFDITVTRIFSDPTTGARLDTEDFQTRYAAEPVIRCVPVAPATPESTAPATPAQPTARRPRRAPRPGVPG